MYTWPRNLTGLLLSTWGPITLTATSLSWIELGIEGWPAPDFGSFHYNIYWMCKTFETYSTEANM